VVISESGQMGIAANHPDMGNNPGHDKSIQIHCHNLCSILDGPHPFQRVWRSVSESTHVGYSQGREQGRLCLCLPEDKILPLRDRGKDGRAVRLRNAWRTATESGAKR
jgi:hypothetical protein